MLAPITYIPKIARTQMSKAVVVVVSDSVDNGVIGPTLANRVMVSATATLVIRFDGAPEDGSQDITFKNLVAGIWHEMPPFRRIMSTGTTGSITIIAGTTF